MRRVLAMLTALAAVMVATAPAHADAPAASCPGLTATADTFASPGIAAGSWLENMGFDGHGGMWVSELFANQLVHFDASGTPGRSLSVASPGASLIDGGNRMYALFGDSATGAVNPGAAGAVTFDPTAAAPVATPFFSGMSMANGGAIDNFDNLYIADSLGTGVVKVGPAGDEDTAFRTAAPIPSGDGLTIIGNTLYVTELTTSDSPIDAIPLDHPEQYRTLAKLSPDGTPLLLDDLDVGPDGRLYVASNLGKIIRVDPHSGAACVVYTTAMPLNSVRFAKGFAPYGPGDLFATSELGTITHVKLTGYKPLIAVRLRVNGRKLRFRVTSKAPCRAGVRIAGGRTDTRGRLTLRRKHHRAKTYTARKPGCTPGSVAG